MRKALSIAAILLITIAAVYFSSCNNESTVKSDDTKDSLKQVIARGEYLVNHVAGCIDCHSKRDFTKYSGPVVPGSEGGGGMLFDPKFGLPGMIYGKNITPDSATGIGTWTEQQFFKAIREGKYLGLDNTRPLLPPMPWQEYRNASDDDLRAVFAFLKSTKPVRNVVPPPVLRQKS